MPYNKVLQANKATMEACVLRTQLLKASRLNTSVGRTYVRDERGLTNNSSDDAAPGAFGEEAAGARSGRSLTY